MSEECGTSGGDEEHVKERDYLEDLGVDERIILKYILQK
jgi:hypothetical protein